MAKPTRYTKQDRRRKRLTFPLRNPPSVGALIRHQSQLRRQHVEKALLAVNALRRCTELESWISETMRGLEHFPGSSGVCMCGSPIEGHESALTCGHSPVDSGDYHLSELAREAAALLAKPLEGLHDG